MLPACAIPTFAASGALLPIGHSRERPLGCGCSHRLKRRKIRLSGKRASDYERRSRKSISTIQGYGRARRTVTTDPRQEHRQRAGESTFARRYLYACHNSRRSRLRPLNRVGCRPPGRSDAAACGLHHRIVVFPQLRSEISQFLDPKLTSRFPLRSAAILALPRPQSR
jgi:hypothetical protein